VRKTPKTLIPQTDPGTLCPASAGPFLSKHLGTISRVSELLWDPETHACTEGGASFFARRKPLTGVRYDTVMIFLLLVDVLAFAGASAIFFSMACPRKARGTPPLASH